MSERPKILVTNDDGYTSPGLIALADALADFGDVTVVAPDADQSGVGHAVSIKTPVRVAPVADRGTKTYRVVGTPADCVVVGAYDLCGGMPALVVSGINRGANLGDDVNYSGTVAAAFEGAIIGVPSIAISLAASWPEHAHEHHWETAAQVACDAARDVLANGLPRLTLLNINVPNVSISDMHGIRYVRQGRKTYDDRIERREDPRGGIYFWLWGSFDATQIADDTDLAAIRDGCASVTPITIDRTNYAELSEREIRAVHEARG